MDPPPPVKEDFVNPFAGNEDSKGHTEEQRELRSEAEAEATNELGLGPTQVQASGNGANIITVPSNSEQPAVNTSAGPTEIPYQRESAVTASSSSNGDHKSRTSGEAIRFHQEKTSLEKTGKTATALDEGTGVVEKLRTAGSKAAHKLHIDHVRVAGPTRFLNPTNIHMNIRLGGDQKGSDGQIQQAKELALLWRSRDNRKGRNSIAVPAIHTADEPTFLPMRYTPRVKTTFKQIGDILKRMLVTFPYWDMAFWSGWSYTIGSALFVVDGVMAWGPVAYGEEWGVPEYGDKYVGPLSFFIGALFYQVGAVMAYLEAVNDGSFHGAAMRRLLDGHEEDQRKMLDNKIHGFFSNLAHSHHDEDGRPVDPEAGWRTKEARHLRPGSIYPAGFAPAPRRGAVDMGGEEGDESMYLTWRWWPSWHAIRTHHVYEIGWLATTIQLFGVTLYGVTAVVVLPGVLSSLAWWQKLGAFWVPQVVAASCFLIASLMFMFETQEKWWKPEPTVLGWWIGVWATIGSVGFVLIACFGIVAHTQTWAEYQSDLATIWGSAAYLTSSFLQWYEALNKNPIEELLTEPGEMKSFQIHVL